MKPPSLLRLRSEPAFGHHDTRIVAALAGVFLVAIVPLALAGARNSSEQQAARITVRGLLPLIQAYAADEGSYANMTVETLARYDRGLPRDARIREANRDSYCVMATTAHSVFSHRASRGSRSCFESLDNLSLWASAQACCRKHRILGTARRFWRITSPMLCQPRLVFLQRRRCSLSKASK